MCDGKGVEGRESGLVGEAAVRSAPEPESERERLPLCPQLKTLLLILTSKFSLWNLL